MAFIFFTLRLAFLASYIGTNNLIAKLSKVHRLFYQKNFTIGASESALHISDINYFLLWVFSDKSAGPIFNFIHM